MAGLKKSSAIQMMNRLRNKVDSQTRLKNRLLAIVDGKTVTIVMTIIVLFSLFGDDIRVWTTPKVADPFFFAGYIISLLMFGIEILVKTVVDEEFKYSFFFWLDIVATLSLVLDVPWLFDPLTTYVFNSDSSESAVNVKPGVSSVDDGSKKILTTILKSLRLIRLIRILKIYKYIVGGNPNKNEDTGGKKRRKKRAEKKEGEDEIKEETVFQQETNPSKLGKNMLDTLNRWTISIILLMLMTLPILNPPSTDYSGIFALKKVFWFGRSSCTDSSSYFCDRKPRISKDGWNEILRGMTRASQDEEMVNRKKLLWLYVPDFTREGRLDHITDIKDRDGKVVWEETKACAGFTVS